MHKKVRIYLKAVSAAALVGACLCGQVLMAQNVVVGTCTNPSNTIATIQQGVNQAASGSTVLICPGTYAEQVEISEPLTLSGIQSGNADAVIITPPAGGVAQNTVSYLGVLFTPTAAQLWIHDATSVTITNLTVDGSNNGITAPSCSLLLFGIYFENSSGTVGNVVTRNQTTDTCGKGVGIWIESAPSNTANVTIHNNGVHSFDGSGIVARGAGTDSTIQSNSVVGPGPSAALNEITMDGATGTIANNMVIDAINSGIPPDDLDTGSCGIALGRLSQGVTLSGNMVGNTQCGIALYGSSNNTISSNIIFGTRVNDGVYVCGNGNTVMGNTITDSDQAGIHLSCSETYPSLTANNNTVSKNTVNGAGYGVLLQPGTTGNQLKSNKFFNVTQVVH